MFNKLKNLLKKKEPKSVKEELSRQIAWEIMNYIEVQEDTEYITSSKVFHGRIRILRDGN